MKGHAQIHRPVRGRLVVKVTGTRCSRARLREMLGGGVPVTWNTERKVFEVARNHLDQLLEVARREFTVVDVYVDYRTTEQCTPACAHARADTWWDCVCSCRAANHGGGTAGYRMIAAGAVLVHSTDITRTHTRYVRGTEAAA